MHGKGKEVKAGVVVKPTEKDEERARVIPDQYCDEPFIPGGARPSKPFMEKGGWEIIVGRDAVYNPPKNEGIFGGRVRIECGARVNGCVFGREYIEVESGKSKGTGIIYGCITSVGEIRIIRPKEDYSEGCLRIVGDILAKKTRIEGPTIINGNIICERDINISAPTIVYGNIYSKGGIIKLKKSTSAYLLIAGNKPGEEKTEEGIKEIEAKEYGIEIGEKVSLLNPLIWTENGKIKLEQDVRLMHFSCDKCAMEGRVKNIFSCPFFIEGSCKDYPKLTNDDIIEYLHGQIITDSWRTYHDDPVRYDIVSRSMWGAIDSKKAEGDYRSIFEKDRWRVATVDDLAPKIEQRIEKMFTSGEAATAYGREEALGRIGEKEIEAKVEEKKIELEGEKEKYKFIKSYMGRDEGARQQEKITTCPTCGLEIRVALGEAKECPYCKTIVRGEN